MDALRLAFLSAGDGAAIRCSAGDLLAAISQTWGSRPTETGKLVWAWLVPAQRLSSAQS